VQSTSVRNIPVLTVPETIVACAAVLTDEALARLCHEAGVLHGTVPEHVETLLAREGPVKGAATLRAIMRGDVKVVLSKLERAFLRLLTEHHLPLPQMNRPAGAYRVDCRWPEHRLTVELDGYRFHNSRYSWRQGLEREREARKRKDRFRRYDWDDVTKNSAFVVGELRELLSA
jgi:very-short-patch-repair endonuclease